MLSAGAPAGLSGRQKEHRLLAAAVCGAAALIFLMAALSAKPKGDAQGGGRGYPVPEYDRCHTAQDASYWYDPAEGRWADGTWQPNGSGHWEKIDEAIYCWQPGSPWRCRP